MTLMPRVVLARELDGSTDAGALDDRLQVTNDPVPEFEADIRSLVETKQAARLIGEAVVAEVLVEAVAQMEVSTAGGKPQRGRKTDEREVRFREIDRRVVMWRFLRASRNGREQDSRE